MHPDSLPSANMELSHRVIRSFTFNRVFPLSKYFLIFYLEDQKYMLSSQIDDNDGMMNWEKEMIPTHGWLIWWKGKGGPIGPNSRIKSGDTILLQSLRTTRFLGSDSKFDGP